MKPIPEDTTQVVRKGVEQACRDFTARIAPLGFARTKKMFWTRVHEHTVDFVHLHRMGSTYGHPINYSVDFRVHCGIRILNDTLTAAALNGLESDPDRLRAGKYHLSFNAKSGSTYDRCIADLERFVAEQCEPWFASFQDPRLLLEHPDSILRPPEKDRLRASLEGLADPEMLAKSLKLLGLRNK